MSAAKRLTEGRVDSTVSQYYKNPMEYFKFIEQQFTPCKRFFGRRIRMYMSDNGYCCLLITGDDLDLQLIENTLGIEAAEKWKKGEIIHKRLGEAQRDFIRFGGKINENYNPDQALSVLLDKLLVHEEFLKNLSQKTSMYMLCYIQSDYAQIHYTLSAETLNKIARLGIELSTDILSWGGVEDKKEKKKKKKSKKGKKK